jgi:hypothetical protein
MLPETLERLAALVKQGGIVVGERPLAIATLSGGRQAETRFNAAAESLWGGVADLGTGRVISGVSVDEALRQIGVAPDVEGEGVVWNHRQTDEADWYFVAAPARIGFRGTLRFRAVGEAELWNPTTGSVRPAGWVGNDGGMSRVALDLAPSEAVFVVFRPSGRGAPEPVLLVEHDGAPVADARFVATVKTIPQVVSAAYGDPADAARRMDVAERVAKDLSRGLTVIRGSNEWAGTDPAPQTRKKLLVELRMPDGGTKHLESWEGDALSVVEPGARELPVCEIMNHREVLAWKSGSYRVTCGDGVTLSREMTVPGDTQLTDSWTLGFPPGWGAPASMPLDGLTSWTELDLAGEARAFSGTATYTTDFNPGPLDHGARVALDLGRVEVTASVRINGKPVGCLWSPPYRLDVTRHVNPGVNHLSVEVTNTWFNRLAYDAGIDESQRKTWTINGPARGSALVPSGLIGPVTLRVGRILELP